MEFQFASNGHYGFFFLHTLPSTTAFKFTYGLFCQFCAKISIFSKKKYLVWLLPFDVGTFGGKWRQKLMSERRPDMMHESHFTPPHARRHFLALVGFMEIPVVYASKVYLGKQCQQPRTDCYWKNSLIRVCTVCFRTSLIHVYTVCHSICLFWTHYSTDVHFFLNYFIYFGCLISFKLRYLCWHCIS